MLPIGPIGAGNSPYSSTSAPAGNPLLIDPGELVKTGLLESAVPSVALHGNAQRVNYAATIRHRTKILRAACARFFQKRRGRAAYYRFRDEQRDWLDEYALFSALKRARRGAAWSRWPKDERLRRRAALRSARKSLRDEIEFECFCQFTFARQWSNFKGFCNRIGLGLIGDIPIFVSYDSADVWANRELFKLDADGRPAVVSGVPPDMFSDTGQLWGHPLYRWSRHRSSGYAWWIERFRKTLGQFDAVRIDHFLGFNRCWNVPGAARTARHGRWVSSPGKELLGAVRAALGEVEIIAEDLGVRVPNAIALRDQFGFPGLRVLQNGFGEDARYDQPHNYPRQCVAYTGTHDTPPVKLWFERIARDRRRGRDGLTVRERALRYTAGSSDSIAADMVRCLYGSPADLAIVPMQDVLGLGAGGLMNRPGVARGNWEWRMRAGAASERCAAWLRTLAETYERRVGSH